MKFLVLFAVLLPNMVVAEEITCFDGLGLIKAETLQAASRGVAAAAAGRTDDYLRILRSDSPDDVHVFTRREDSGDALTAHNHLNGLAAPDAHAYFRRAYSTTTMRGEVGDFVVAEYGLVSAEFHALHFVIWEIAGEHWTAINHLWVRRCSPGSRPVRLEPGQLPQSTLAPAESLGDPEAPPVSAATQPWP